MRAQFFASQLLTLIMCFHIRDPLGERTRFRGSEAKSEYVLSFWRQPSVVTDGQGERNNNTHGQAAVDTKIPELGVAQRTG